MSPHSLEDLREAVAGMLAPGVEPPLLDAAFAIARLLQRGDVWSGAENRLAELETLALDRCAALSADDDKARSVLDVLRDQGFRGNTVDYENVENSFLDRVLERGRGLPITLSMLAMHLGATVECRLSGIAFPGHFLVGIDLDGQHPILFDPFHDGRRLGLAELAALHRKTTGEAMTSTAPISSRHLQPAPPRAILSRMLRNLQRHYARRGAHDRVAEVIGLLALLHPEVEGLRTLQGKLHHRLRGLN